MTDKLELPWEVQLLIMLDEGEHEIYEDYIEFFKTQFEDGQMSEREFRRFVATMEQVAEEAKRCCETLKKLVHRANNPGIRLVK